MPSIRNRSRREDSVGQENWITTYSDMVTLLLCFFVLLFSMSTIDLEKFAQVIMSLQEALSGVLESGKTLNQEQMLEQGSAVETDLDSYLREMEQLQSSYQEIRQFLEEEGLTDVVMVMYEERGLLIRFSDKILFEKAKAELQPEAKRILEKIAVVINKLPNDIIVEGHTDNLPIKQPSIYPSNWELSTARATNVAKYLIEKLNVAPERVGIAGYGKYRPIASNDTPEGRQQNRRVDVVIKRLELKSGEETK